MSSHRARLEKLERAAPPPPRPDPDRQWFLLLSLETRRRIIAAMDAHKEAHFPNLPDSEFPPVEMGQLDLDEGTTRQVATAQRIANTLSKESWEALLAARDANRQPGGEPWHLELPPAQLGADEPTAKAIQQAMTPRLTHAKGRADG